MRVASAPRYGGGHMARCLVVARAIRPRARVQFMLCGQDDACWRQRLVDEGFDWCIAGTVSRVDASLVLIDHYEELRQPLHRWRRNGAKIAVFDDFDVLAGRCDLQLLPVGPLPDAAGRQDTLRLGGFDYAPLAPAFCEWPREPAMPLAREILVSFGLRDGPGASLLALEALVDAGMDARFMCTIGSLSPHAGRLKALAARHPGRVELLIDHPNMAALCATADLAVGGGGVAALERAAAGLPGIAVAIADNQEPALAALDAAGAVSYLGPYAALEIRMLVERFTTMSSDPCARQRMSDAGRQVIDGHGAARIADALLALAGGWDMAQRG